MEWEKLADGRSYLPENTILRFRAQGGCYKILGEPIGYGGAGILYPAVRVNMQGGQWVEDGMWIALKEWYPGRLVNTLIRKENGALTEAQAGKNPQKNVSEERGMMRREKAVTSQIFQRGFRLTPLWDLVEEEEISLDGIHFLPAENQYGILERLDEKGQSLGSILRSQPGGCLTAYKSVCILEQVLQALSEVHTAGYLHGDIQENNIFLKGIEPSAEEAGSVTLIDFGSARELLDDGATAPIRDKKLYSTSGYCAPEGSSGNDGNLRLTRASDLYSVGCLMLRMFLGKTMDPKTLMLVVNGKYLYPRQAKKIGCPGVCTDTVNKILKKALAVSPQERYQTAEEMLEQIRRLKRAMQPKQSALAAVDYEAFISYCHEENSIQAAEQIQKKIERYRIPKAIRRSSGKRRMGKVFRDREELSSSSDMEMHLREALAHSEYLILLLSPGVSESVWVKREIEWFLQTHDQEHILPILVDGELEESFPEELRKGEKLEEGQMKLVSVESLAADIRGRTAKERKHRLRTEIYRLLGPMLNCGYDELRQRQKEYQTRRILQFSLTAMGIFGFIAVYIGWQAAQIQKNYWESLTRQSRYLAEVSAQLLEEGDRTAAIQVALEALPESSQDKTKPVTAEAEASLVNALYAYQGISSFAHFLQADYQVEMDGRRKAVQDLSADGNWLLSADEDRTIYIWDTESAERVRTWDKAFWQKCGVDSDVLAAAFLENDTVCLLTETAIVQIRAETEEILLYKDLAETGFKLSSDSTCVTDREKKLLAAADRYGYLQVYRMDDGSLLYARRIEELLGEGMELPQISDLVLSPDGHYAALVCAELWGIVQEGAAAGRLLVIDLWEDTVWTADSERYGYYACCFDAQNRLAVFGYVPSVNLFEDGGMECPGTLECFEVQEKKRIWQQELKCQIGNEKNYGILADEEADRFVLWHDQQISALEGATGEVFRSCRSETQIAAVCKRRENNYLAVTKESGMYLWGGEQLLAKMGTNVTREIEDVLFDTESSTAYLFSYEGIITVMRPKEDSPQKKAELEQKIYGITTYDGEGEFYSVLSYGDEGHNTTTVTFYFGDTDKKWFSLELEGKLDQELILPDQNLYCGVEYRQEDGTYRTSLFAYDMENQKECWRIENETHWGDISLHCLETGEAVALIRQERQVLFLDLRTGAYLENETISLQKEQEYFSGNTYLTNSGRYMLGIAAEADQEGVQKHLVIYDREKKAWKEGFEELGQLEVSSYTVIEMAEKEERAAVYEKEKNQISVIDLEENCIWKQFPFHEKDSCRMQFLRDDSQLLLWNGDGYLKLWDLEENAMLMEDTQKFVSFSNLVTDEEDQILMIRGVDEDSSGVYRNGMWISWIYRLEEDRFYPYVKILNGVYEKGSGRIGEIGEDQKSIYWFEPYSLEELLERGREVIGDTELSEAEKVKYFISS